MITFNRFEFIEREKSEGGGGERIKKHIINIKRSQNRWCQPNALKRKKIEIFK